ncbi:hypothetical protein BU26DRAFT_565023 [Trematosphaeria pertusa]|uniref:Uncharacterized protein n=1 Tax=Trematosphaeria pertusa TaxID=390896 RepID=A0A6A6IHK9_9PLEO|nr:uncharacterized protein BU26DRAFT_565023 [Trematosphaeria pertusa]KAF2249372.1 hypothetical protein BU26DRAFT_565023 [Trematosphaeria pertusa]
MSSISPKTALLLSLLKKTHLETEDELKPSSPTPNTRGDLLVHIPRTPNPRNPHSSGLLYTLREKETFVRRLRKELAEAEDKLNSHKALCIMKGLIDRTCEDGSHYEEPEEDLSSIMEVKLQVKESSSTKSRIAILPRPTSIQSLMSPAPNLTSSEDTPTLLSSHTDLTIPHPPIQGGSQNTTIRGAQLTRTSTVSIFRHLLWTLDCLRTSLPLLREHGSSLRTLKTSYSTVKPDSSPSLPERSPERDNAEPIRAAQDRIAINHISITQNLHDLLEPQETLSGDRAPPLWPSEAWKFEFPFISLHLLKREYKGRRNDFSHKYATPSARDAMYHVLFAPRLLEVYEGLERDAKQCAGVLLEAFRD